MNLLEEQRRLNWLRVYSDSVVEKLDRADLAEDDAWELLTEAKRKILERFPTCEDEYQLIYERRFRRVLIRRGFALPLYDDTAIGV
ncbi:MAG: hypothetical protein WC703_06275 [Candidatus Neomarinimicrobiota bacterium]